MLTILVLICQGLIFERDLVSQAVIDGFQSILIISLIVLTMYTIFLFLRRKTRGENHVVINASSLKTLNPQTVYSIYYLNSMLELENSGVLEISVQSLNSRMSYEHRMEVFRALDHFDRTSRLSNAASAGEAGSPVVKSFAALNVEGEVDLPTETTSPSRPIQMVKVKSSASKPISF